MHDVIFTDSSKCRQCYSCVRNCPVKAVRIKEGRAEIIQSRCIHCGNCVKHCSRGAKIIRDSIRDVYNILETDQRNIALIAPSFPVSFYPLKAEEVIGRLGMLGFDEVWETAIGAEAVIEEVSNCLEQEEEKAFVSSACPAFVNLIEKHYPQLIDFLVPLCSPATATSRIIRNRYGNEKVAIVFIGPCIAKKGELKQQPESYIDEVLTFDELKKIFSRMPEDKKDGWEENVIPYFTASPKGRSISLSAGIVSNIDEAYPVRGLIACDGIQNCIELVQYLQDIGPQKPDFRFCDALMCRGCIDGPCIDCSASIFERKKILNDFIKENESFIGRIEYMDSHDINLKRTFQERKQALPEPKEEDIKNILSSIGKLSPEDELNCGACGYDSCRDKAIAVYQGIAEVEMCIPYLLAKKNELYAELSQRFKIINELNEQLNAIFESSYDGLIVCDTEGKIIKVNSAWKNMMNITDEQIPQNVKELEEEKIIYPSATLLAAKEKRRITFLQENRNGKKFIATGNPIFDEKGKIVGIVTNIRDIEELNRLRNNVMGSREKMGKGKSSYSGIIANSIEFGKVIEIASQAAQFQSNILLLGETGVGKDVVARFIHHLSSVREGPFIKVNCGAIPATLIESELFGYDSGAFTGARKEGKKGFFELADGGTIFLDEVGDLPLPMQVKLLQAIQDKRITRIGGSKSFPVNVRIIAATNKNLQQMVKDGTFRSDLYYRLNVIPIYIPPLRERKDDIIPLAFHFLERFNKQYKCRKEFSLEVPDLLLEYPWPGNVRELENIIERVVVTSKGDIICSHDFPGYIFNANKCPTGRVLVQDILPLKDALDEVERQIIIQAYKTFKNTYEAAEALKINQSTVVRKYKKWVKGY
ncbi:MAG: sigma 54-interacting transcriptional regulator [Clostridiaceae bacterium]|nr:sigma 54-interacting transcriptional regulator [Clostridiaceae bacterium]